MNSGDKPELRISETPEQAARECSKYILSLLAGRARATIAISGGSTPKLLFAGMARAKFDWSNVHFFWVDERCVPPDNKDSNFKLANETLLAPAGIPEGNIHRIYGELAPAEAAAKYVADIKQFFDLQEHQVPEFDVLHRGMGPDAHTASLFPGTPLVYDLKDIAASVWVEKMKMHRVTLLPGVLMAAKQTVLQVSGEEKAEALHQVLEAPEDFIKYPCQIASRDRRAIWFLDSAAASKL